MSDEAMPEVGPQAFGRWLEVQLQYREWSKADLVRALGTHQGNVTRWIRGDVRVSTRTVDRIADLFNEDLDFLLTLAGHRPVALDRPNDERRRLLALLERVDLNEDRAWSVRSLLEDYARRPLADSGQAPGTSATRVRAVAEPAPPVYRTDNASGRGA